MTIARIIDAINNFAPLSLQESWDNSGVQVGAVDRECTGVLLCVDVTPGIIDEAARRGCNLVIAHHPLLFRGLKQICPGDNVVQQSVIEAIRHDITVFSSHTSLDSTPGGISHRIARMLGAEVLSPLSAPEGSETGLGVVAVFDKPLTPAQFVERVKDAFGSSVVRCSAALPDATIRRIALCGGSGGEFIPLAVEKGCDVMLTSDVRYHDFVDFGKRIFIADIGHYESEECAKQIFYDIISDFFPNFAVCKSETERNPINYL